MITLLSWYELKMIPIKFHRLICHIIPKYFQSISDYIESFEVEAVNGCIRVVFEDVANNIMASPDKTIFLKIQVVLMQVGFFEDEVNRNNTVRSGIVGKSGDDDTNNWVFADERNHSKDKPIRNIQDILVAEKILQKMVFALNFNLVFENASHMVKQ